MALSSSLLSWITLAKFFTKYKTPELVIATKSRPLGDVCTSFLMHHGWGLGIKMNKCHCFLLDLLRGLEENVNETSLCSHQFAMRWYYSYLSSEAKLTI